MTACVSDRTSFGAVNGSSSSEELSPSLLELGPESLRMSIDFWPRAAASSALASRSASFALKILCLTDSLNF
jgi:hypothetical protein